jgi:serine/threonine protein kinase/HD superfamily phosphohydrolase YqeK
MGEGGMGAVFKARDAALNRYVAVKVARTQGRQIGRQFVEEARAAAALEHPNIVSIYHAGEEKGIPYFAMQYIDGKTLDQIIETGLPELPQTLAWMIQIAEALQFAHVRGMVHYDVKPGNIMIDSMGRAILLDFGLAKVFQGRGRPEDQLLASPEFASPEQLLQRPSDKRSDIYSLGAVFYLLITGRLPHVGANVVAVVKSKLEKDPPPVASINPEIPAELAHLIDRMVKRRKTERPTSLEEVLDVLAAYRRREEKRVSPDISRITEKIKKVPPFPQVALELMQELGREDTNAERIERIISGDSVLVARLLRVVNSAYYSIINRVTTIKHAVSLLGMRQVQDLAFGIYLKELGRNFHSGSAHPLQMRYWSHSVAVAFISEGLARFLALPTVIPGEAYMAGLLHDIGLLIFSHFELRKTAQVVSLQADRKCSCLDLERQVIGVTHPEMADWLASKWGLPENLRTVAVNHHTPRPESPTAELETIVRLADAIALRAGYGFYLSDDGWELEKPLHRMLSMANSRIPEQDLISRLTEELGPTFKGLEEYIQVFSTGPDEEGDEETGSPRLRPVRPEESSTEASAAVTGAEQPRGVFGRLWNWFRSS